MTADDIIAAALLVAMSGGYLAAAVIAPWRRAFNRRWMQRHALPSTPELATLVEQQRSRRSWALGLGGLLGTAMGVVILVLGRSALPDPLPVWLLLTAAVAGSGLGVGGHALLVATQRVAGPTRVAQAEAAGLDQYVRRGPLLAIRAAATIAAAALVVAGSLPIWSGSGLGPVVAWGGVALLLVGWAGTEVLVRRLVARPQPAESTAELAWRDALRGELVRDLFSIPAVLAMVGSALAATPAAYSLSYPDWAVPVVLGLFGTMIVVYLAMLVVSLIMIWSTNPIRHHPPATVSTGPAV